jgi:hypothetical protein
MNMANNSYLPMTKTAKKGALWMGDNGWDNPIVVDDPQKPDVVLSKHEWLWLQSCWMAATAFENH